MIVLDAFFRFSGIGLLLMLAVITLLKYRQWKSAPYLILTCISVSALFFGYAPETLLPSGHLYVTARIVDVPHLVFLWLFTLSLFEPNFRLKKSYILIGVLYAAPILWIRLENFGWAPNYSDWIMYMVSVMSLVLMLHLCVSTLRGRANDLMDKRRASRIYFVLVIASVAVITALIEPVFLPGSELRMTATILTIWPAIVWGFVWMVSFNERAVTFANSSIDQANLSERDKQLRDKLIYKMNDEMAFKDAKLSIVTLAAKLGVNQHRLRSLINQALGYRNFSEFVNAYRIKSVKLALADIKKDHIPILTLSLDCGFKSLSAFNRSFKDAEGITPSEYRNSRKQSRL